MRIYYYLLIILLVFITSCNESVKHQFRGEAQGSYYSVIYYDQLDRNLQSEIENLLYDFDKSASNYQLNSIISKVNRGETVILDEIFIGNFKLAKRISEETDGNFDITVRPLVQAWGFGSVEAQDMDSAIVDSIMYFVGYDKVTIINGEVVKNDKRLKLDFDAIAQGYSVDVVCDFLESKGINSYLVDIGGEVYASSTKNENENWTVGIEKPNENASYGDELSAVINLSAKGMATSGNYRKFYIKDGVKYSHTISPHTGYPISSKLLSATVIANTTAEADAYATSFMVMGLEKSKEFISTHDEIDAFLIYSGDNGEYENYYTDGLKGMLKQ